MKKRMKKLHRSNEGFSLMELIVTMLISSIVTAAVAGFLTMGLNYYRRTNAETALQTESQVAELFLTELIQEAQNYRVISSCPEGIDYALEVTRDDKKYIVVQKGTLLLYGLDETGSSSDDTEKITGITSQDLNKVFLAKHVSDFSVTPAKKEEALSTVYNGLVRLGLQFATDGKTYTGNQTVSLRNTVRNSTTKN